MKQLSSLLLVGALSLVGMTSAQAPAGKIISRTGYVKFFSTTPMENISAETNTAVAIFDPQGNHLRVRIQISTFVFPNHLMQEHFNENYMESDKFPLSNFDGTAKTIHWDKLKAGGIDTVSITGDLEIHGVKKQYTVPGTFKILPTGDFQGEAVFPVKIADHGIKVPAIVFKNIADTVQVTLRLTGKVEAGK